MQCAFIPVALSRYSQAKCGILLRAFVRKSEMAGYFELRSICKRLHHLICEFKPYFRFDLHFYENIRTQREQLFHFGANTARLPI